MLSVQPDQEPKNSVRIVVLHPLYGDVFPLALIVDH